MTCLAFHVHNINKPGPSSLLLRPSFLFVNIFIYIFFSFFTAAYSFVVVCRPIRQENFLGFFGIACCRQKFVERKTVGGDGHVELVVVRMIFGPLPGRKQNGPELFLSNSFRVCSTIDTSTFKELSSTRLRDRPAVPIGTRPAAHQMHRNTPMHFRFAIIPGTSRHENANRQNDYHVVVNHLSSRARVIGQKVVTGIKLIYKSQWMASDISIVR